GLLLPGGSGCGKTTLVAALVAAGYQYCSDDLTTVARDSLLLYPFAKSLCIKAGAIEPLAARYPALRDSPRYRRFTEEGVCFLQPPATSWLAAPAPIRYVVFPCYVPGAP